MMMIMMMVIIDGDEEDLYNDGLALKLIKEANKTMIQC